jgi:hypothetical protein
VGTGEFVELQGRPEAIRQLASELVRLGSIEAAPGWLVSAVWLQTRRSDFIASSTTKVLSDGYIARPLAIQSASDFEAQLAGELVDINGRLIARQSAAQLPEASMPARPATLEPAGEGPYSTTILIRRCERGPTTHRVACGMLFEFKKRRLLVGTDLGTLAMVVADDCELVERYVASCETLPPGEYLDDHGF